MRSNTTVNFTDCVGLKESLAINRLTGHQTGNLTLNEYAGKNFYQGENYRAAIERLDDGKTIRNEKIKFDLLGC